MDSRTLLMADSLLNDDDKLVVRFLAKHLLEKDDWIGFDELYGFRDFGKDKMKGVHARLFRLGLLPNRSSQGPGISPDVLELVKHWDNPPLPDYGDKLTKWFWSKPWSIVVYVLVVGLPALLGWVVMLRTILEWLGIKK